MSTCTHWLRPLIELCIDSIRWLGRKKGTILWTVQLCTWSPVNFGDLTLFLTYAFEEGVDGFCEDSIKIVVVHKVPL